ncbi:MAG: CoA transferase [Caulobacterales bacterium]|nr:CoA transferase [Caulobacterales bacterium]
MTATSDRRQALTGLRVLDLTRLLPGAFCSGLLADMGAEVIKVEEPKRGDYNRAWEPKNKHESGSFLLLNRNKKSLTLNLKSQAGKAAFLRLVTAADVVLEGFRPGVMDRLGLSYDRLRDENGRLIYCAISGYGQDGPYRLAPGHDLNYMALSGALQLFGRASEGPIVPGLSIADVGGGSLTAAVGILAAIVARETTGEGQYIDISMMDGVVSWLALHGADYLFGGVEPRGGERPFIGQAACYNIYRCADGKHISLGIIEDHFWRRFCDIADLPGEAEAQWPTGAAAEKQKWRLAALFETRPRDVWVETLLRADIPASPVNSIEEALADPQFQHRRMLQYVDHPVEGRVPQLGFPIKFSDTPCAITAPPPLLGEHTAALLRELGYSESDVEDMRAEGAI